MKTLSILGSTGSIGRNALEIVRRFPERFAVKALAAKRSVALLAEQVREFTPDAVAVFDDDAARKLEPLLPQGCRTRVLRGAVGYSTVAAWEGADVTLAAMVGAAGLLPTLAAIDSGKTIALANKETLVMAGAVVTARAAARGATILPVDSEHSAIFQCLQGQRREDAVQILLTASGGPFFRRAREEFAALTAADALRHPNWSMGAKITIDSATMMNKGLEVIEAKWLFGVPQEMIRVVVHPQSIGVFKRHADEFRGTGSGEVSLSRAGVRGVSAGGHPAGRAQRRQRSGGACVPGGTGRVHGHSADRAADDGRTRPGGGSSARGHTGGRSAGAGGGRRTGDGRSQMSRRKEVAAEL